MSACSPELVTMKTAFTFGEVGEHGPVHKTGRCIHPLHAHQGVFGQYEANLVLNCFLYDSSRHPAKQRISSSHHCDLY